MLLKVRTLTQNDLSTLQITEVGGKTRILPQPIRPYYWAHSPFEHKLAVTCEVDEGYEKTLLSNRSKELLTQVSFNTVDDLRFNRVPDGM